MATHTNRKNQISQLMLENGTCLTQHHDKAEALWNSFKGRLGISEELIMQYHVESLINMTQLPRLDSPFTVEEINAALTHMPGDHAPGPFHKKNVGLLLSKTSLGCVDAEFGHTPNHLLVHGPLTSLAGLWISRSVRPVFTSHRENLMNSCTGGTSSGQEHLGVL
jgi:hypothetical protein